MFLYFDFFFLPKVMDSAEKSEERLAKKQCEIFNINQSSKSLMETSENKVTNKNTRT